MSGLTIFLVLAIGVGVLILFAALGASARDEQEREQVAKELAETARRLNEVRAARTQTIGKPKRPTSADFEVERERGRVVDRVAVPSKARRSTTEDVVERH
jgi:uncharacterized membrane protein